MRASSGRSKAPGRARCVESIEGAPGSKWIARDGARDLPASLELSLGRSETLELEAVYLRTFREAKRVRGEAAAPYEWVGLMNRYRCAEARLVVRGLPPSIARTGFGSIVDLGTGEERPARVRAEAEGVELIAPSCPARMLLRIHFALALR